VRETSTYKEVEARFLNIESWADEFCSYICNWLVTTKVAHYLERDSPSFVTELVYKEPHNKGRQSN
jgi:uncharacterized protein YutD